jgi:hypothetical protein
VIVIVREIGIIESITVRETAIATGIKGEALGCMAETGTIIIIETGIIEIGRGIVIAIEIVKRTEIEIEKKTGTERDIKSIEEVGVTVRKPKRENRKVKELRIG